MNPSEEARFEAEAIERLPACPLCRYKDAVIAEQQRRYEELQQVYALLRDQDRTPDSGG